MRKAHTMADRLSSLLHQVGVDAKIRFTGGSRDQILATWPDGSSTVLTWHLGDWYGLATIRAAQAATRRQETFDAPFPR